MLLPPIGRPTIDSHFVCRVFCIKVRAIVLALVSPVITAFNVQKNPEKCCRGGTRRNTAPRTSGIKHHTPSSLVLLQSLPINHPCCGEPKVPKPSSPTMLHLRFEAGYAEALEAAMRLSADDVCGQLREGGVEFDPAMSKVSICREGVCCTPRKALCVEVCHDVFYTMCYHAVEHSCAIFFKCLQLSAYGRFILQP